MVQILLFQKEGRDFERRNKVNMDNFGEVMMGFVDFMLSQKSVKYLNIKKILQNKNKLISKYNFYRYLGEEKINAIKTRNVKENNQ